MFNLIAAIVAFALITPDLINGSVDRGHVFLGIAGGLNVAAWCYQVWVFNPLMKALEKAKG